MQWNPNVQPPGASAAAAAPPPPAAPTSPPSRLPASPDTVPGKGAPAGGVNGGGGAGGGSGGASLMPGGAPMSFGVTAAEEDAAWERDLIRAAKMEHIGPRRASQV